MSTNTVQFWRFLSCRNFISSCTTIIVQCLSSIVLVLSQSLFDFCKLIFRLFLSCRPSSLRTWVLCVIWTNSSLLRIHENWNSKCNVLKNIRKWKTHTLASNLTFQHNSIFSNFLVSSPSIYFYFSHSRSERFVLTKAYWVQYWLSLIHTHTKHSKLKAKERKYRVYSMTDWRHKNMKVCMRISAGVTMPSSRVSLEVLPDLRLNHILSKRDK